MTYSSDEFEKLQRLIVLKRHEQPPPGYFDRFADRVMARLEAEGARQNPTWWQQWWEALTAPPAAVLSAAALVLGIGTLGLLLLQSLELESDGSLMAGRSSVAVGSAPTAAITPVAALKGSPPTMVATAPVSSFSPVLGEGAPPFLFNPSGVRAVRVSYSLR